MNNKSYWIALILIMAMASCGFFHQAKAGQDPPVGLYTVINLPLEDLPQYSPGFFYNPKIAEYSSGASLQVLYVLKDPRDVPLMRYGYWDRARSLAVGPNDKILGDTDYSETLGAILDLDPITINVYVRVWAPDNASSPDPLFWGDEWGERPSLVVAGDGLDMNQFGGTYGLSCAVPEYATGQNPYPAMLDAGIAGGDAVDEEGIYDPRAYAPPLPWYPYEEAVLQPGETREGWISCMAPDVPLDEIAVMARHPYAEAAQTTPEPAPTFGVNEAENPTAEEECVQVESFDDPACLEAECCTVVLVPDSTEEALVLTESAMDATGADVSRSDALQETPYSSTVAWSFDRVRNIPENGITIKNVGLTLKDGSGQEISEQGTVIIYSAHVTRTETPPGIFTPNSLGYKFHFVSRLKVEPNSLSIEDVDGYELQGIDLDIEVYRGAGDPDREAILVQYEYKLEEFNKAGSPFEGYARIALSPNSFAGFGDGDELPLPLWFSVTNGEQLPGNRYKYPAAGLNIRSYSLESRTTMCDVVDCQEVTDPTEDITQVRTVPVFCRGEWANNFTLSGMRAETVDFFGVPPGLVTYPDVWAHSSVFNYSPEIWFFEGELLGGLTPWWFDGHEAWEFRRSTQLEGTIIDEDNGNYLDVETLFLPLYDQLKNQRTYYAEVDERVIGHGWMPGAISQGFVIAGEPVEKTSFQNKLFMFQAEGPIWTRSCSRPLIANHGQLGLYSSGISSASVTNSEEHVMTNIFPGMEYPLSMPRITGDLYSIGEIGDKAFGYTFMPTEVAVVPGRSESSVVYVREENKFYPASEKVNTNNEAFFRSVNAEIIPPGNSLVFVKIEKDPPGGPVECQYINNEIFQLTSPGLFPATSRPGNFRRYGLFTIFCPDDFSEAWLVFIVPSLKVDVSQLIFTIRGDEYWSMWRLD